MTGKVKWLLIAFWFSYTTMLPGEPPKIKIMGPFDEASLCADQRDLQVAWLVALQEQFPALQWSVTPGIGDPCDSNLDAKKPR